MEPVFGIPPDLIIGPSADVLPSAGEVNWGVEAFALARLREVSDGAGVVVGVIDTGVDQNHPLLAGQCVAAKDFTGSASGARDRQGHGTHCTGTVNASDPRIGVAPGAKTVHGKGLGDSGSGGGAGIAAAMRWCVEQGATVLSMSLGAPSPDPRIKEACDELAARGVLIVCAAGNSGPNTPDVDFPGRFESVVSVAALGRDFRPASFSSAGAKIDGSGPGVDIWSCRPGGGFVQMSGTSMATPFVAGVMALWAGALAKHGRKLPPAAEVRRLLRSRSVDTHTPGVDRRTGPGWVSPLLLALQAGGDPPQVA